jgi:hypothetical protein
MSAVSLTAEDAMLVQDIQCVVRGKQTASFRNCPNAKNVVRRVPCDFVSLNLYSFSSPNK